MVSTSLSRVFCFPPQPNVGLWDLTIDLPSGPNVLVGTRSFLQSMWDLHQIHPFGAQHPYTGTPPRVYPFGGTASSLAHRSVLWDPTKTTSLRGLASLLVHRLVSTPFGGTTSSLTHRSVLWDPHQIHLLRGPTLLLAHRLVSTPLWGNNLLVDTSPDVWL